MFDLVDLKKFAPAHLVNVIKGVSNSFLNINKAKTTENCIRVRFFALNIKNHNIYIFLKSSVSPVNSESLSRRVELQRNSSSLIILYR